MMDVDSAEDDDDDDDDESKLKKEFEFVDSSNIDIMSPEFDSLPLEVQVSEQSIDAATIYLIYLTWSIA